MPTNIDFLNSFSKAFASLNLGDLIIQALLLLLLSTLLAAVYTFTGNSLSNRSRLALTFPLMSLTTMLIILIIKSSLALSLGLVGALSIVRFRSAIKDPEELAFIFLAITLGLGFGANQALLTSIFFGVILAVILIQAALRGKIGKHFSDSDSLHLELIFTAKQSLTDITKILDKFCSQIKFVRSSQSKQQIIMFLIKPKSIPALELLQADLKKLDSHLEITLLQYQPLA